MLYTSSNLLRYRQNFSNIVAFYANNDNHKLNKYDLKYLLVQ